MEKENTNWYQSVAAVCIREGKVLLARHTYGGGKGKLIIPGGYVELGETPEDAVKREFMEETGIEIQPTGVIGVRFNCKDWYVIFAADYVSGQAHSDGDENSEVIWMDADEAQSRDDVPDLTKVLIRKALLAGALELTPYKGLNAPYFLYSIPE